MTVYYKGERYAFGKCWRLSLKTRERQSKAKTGANNPNWRGGESPLLDYIRHRCYKYRQWRSDVFERDNYTCQECGEKKKRLEAHHIKSLRQIIKENKIKTIKQALKCAELWDINNGVVSCRKCHKD